MGVENLNLKNDASLLYAKFVVLHAFSTVRAVGSYS
jgi:hypothetical protein